LEPHCCDPTGFSTDVVLGSILLGHDIFGSNFLSSKMFCALHQMSCGLPTYEEYEAMQELFPCLSDLSFCVCTLKVIF
jgi:hypothetical protein